MSGLQVASSQQLLKLLASTAASTTASANASNVSRQHDEEVDPNSVQVVLISRQLIETLPEMDGPAAAEPTRFRALSEIQPFPSFSPGPAQGRNRCNCQD